MRVYEGLARTTDALHRVRKADDNAEWEAKHAETIDKIVERYMPSGSGVDNGTTFDEEKSGAQRLVFYTSFHHMDEHGSYAGWTEHTGLCPGTPTCPRTPTAAPKR